LPGGGIRSGESPTHAAVRDIREEAGTDVELVDLLGLYTLTGHSEHLPDVVVYVFRARTAGEVTLNAPGRIGRLGWYDPAELPEPVTATARWAVVDSLAGRSGILRVVTRDPQTVPA
jgi:ADP-ribose pyrophosphatase YjhB (NUDIX family)